MWHTVIMTEESTMAGSEAVPAGAPVLRVHGPSRLAFAGTTLALVTLASLATAALVNESTSSVPGSAAPGLQALPPLVTPGGDSVVVDRAPGTLTLSPPRTAVAPAVRTVVDALVGGAQGSSTLPPAVSGGSGFPVTGVLRGTTGTPVTVPVTVPVVAPEVPPVTTPDTTPTDGPSAKPPVKPPVVHPTHVPTAEPSKVTRAVERAAARAERAAKKAAHKAEHATKPQHERATRENRDQVEDQRFHEQAKQARHAKHAKHSS
jgi:hypothetical protein